MASNRVQYVHNDKGEDTAVIVPIALWREIAAARETAYLLRSDTMKQRLLDARRRKGGVSLEEIEQKLAPKKSSRKS
ncbi:MAG TPA: prevent-host-death protein [Candidatus Hydrogenedentes bacterium]|nr:prevent-host-death protein [Candidatus Hydrogenedentota bacterium]HRK35702.1 prevent-host-death protein [Candidatus Hydrogenedentota bacterium]